MDGSRPKQKLTYLVDPKLDRQDALALLRDIQELGVERGDVDRTNLWSTMILDDGTVVELSDRWVQDDSGLVPHLRLAATSGIQLPPPTPEVLAARAETEEAAKNISHLRQAASDE